MKQNLIRLSEQYVTALRKQLKQGPQASLQPALELGRQAVALGLETLDLARIHEQALVTLELSYSKNGFTKLAGIFFTEANTLIEETHRDARQTKVHLSRLMTKLDVYKRQRLPLGLEPGDDILGVHAQLDDLECHAAADGMFLIRHVNRAAAALADFLQQLVMAKRLADGFVGRVGHIELDGGLDGGSGR